MIALLLAGLAATGTYLLYDALAHPQPRTEMRHFRSATTNAGRFDLDRWLTQAGLEDVERREFLAVIVALGTAGALAGWLLFAGALPAIAVGAFGASFPLAGYRAQRKDRQSLAAEAWPRLIEEIRVQVGSLGRSIPQALFDVGLRGPAELRPAFAAAHREWLISTDFARTIAVLKLRLADATADMVCETLLVAHEVGGSEIDRRLEALAEDRTQDCQGRNDARARQAGAIFARRFVLFVPIGMALAGMSVGNGRAAYSTLTGQVLVLVGIAIVAICWLWAGRVMRLPDEDRVFSL